MSLLGNRVRSSATLGTHSRMNFCPPLPGTTVMTSIMSTLLPSASEMAEAGVAGEMATAARILCEWIKVTSSCASSESRGKAGGLDGWMDDEDGVGGWKMEDGLVPG